MLKSKKGKEMQKMGIKGNGTKLKKSKIEASRSQRSLITKGT